MNNTTNDNDFTVGNNGEVSGLIWYRTIELANDLLREMISYYAREIIKEENNTLPDFEKITDLQKKQKEIIAINNNPSSFASLEQMNKIIEVLSPPVKKIYA
jgi:hypothetical protein